MSFYKVRSNGEPRVERVYTTLDELELALTSGFPHGSVDVYFPIGFHIDARARYYGDGRAEEVEISQDGKLIVTLTRETGRHPDGDIGFSCSPNRDGTPVKSFNIDFRDRDDLTRGVVWVVPGAPASAYLTLYPVGFGKIENAATVKEVVTAAERALNAKLLCHFGDKAA